jgi:integrase
VLGARWGEIDETAATWVVPAERMKAKAGKRRPHRVPLSRPALKLIADLRKTSCGDFIFSSTGTRPLPTKAMDDLLRAMGYARDKTTVHGFRASFRSWAAEATSTAPEIAEAALAHVTGGASELAYQRSDHLTKRAHLMAAWAAYCARPARAGTVSEFRSRAARRSGL